MNKVTGGLTILFDDPFWVGIFECLEDGRLSVCKITFGAEPKSYEVYEFILKHYYQLNFSPSVEVYVKQTKKNPKRRQREIHKQTLNTGIATKSQQALKLQREQIKIEKKISSKEKRAEDVKFRFELKQRKKKEKHRGR